VPTRPRTEWIVFVTGLLVVLIVLLYSAYRIQAGDRRWQEFNDYVRARDARWEQYIYRTDASLKVISERLAVLGARP
jgi:uncharacterized membrane protein YcfT